MGVASLSALGGKNLWAESVWGAVGVRCSDLGDKMRPLLGGSVMGGSTVVGSPQKRQHSIYQGCSHIDQICNKQCGCQYDN